MGIDTKEIVVTTTGPAVQWELVERARLDYEAELKAAGQLEPGEFVKVLKHRIVQKQVGAKTVYDVYVTFQTEMGPGAPPPGKGTDEILVDPFAGVRL